MKRVIPVEDFEQISRIFIGQYWPIVKLPECFINSLVSNYQHTREKIDVNWIITGVDAYPESKFIEDVKSENFNNDLIKLLG